MKARRNGFTLIEVVVAMVIIAILTAIAIPNYTDYIRRSNRSDARGQLLQAGLWMERFRTENGTYVGAALPAPLLQSPPTGTSRYTIAVGGLTATTYVLTATPVGTMAGDVCGNLVLNNLGQRTRTGAAPLELCWDR